MQWGKRAWQLEKRCVGKVEKLSYFSKKFFMVLCIELIVIRTQKGEKIRTSSQDCMAAESCAKQSCTRKSKIIKIHPYYILSLYLYSFSICSCTSSGAYPTSANHACGSGAARTEKSIKIHSVIFLFCISTIQSF